MRPLSQLFVYCCVLLHLVVGLQGRLFLAQNGVLYCKWSNRGLCDKKLPFCAQITTTGTTPTTTCKHYKNECQFLIDKCLGKTEFGRVGIMVNFSPACSNIGVGYTATC